MKNKKIKKGKSIKTQVILLSSVPALLLGIVLSVYCAYSSYQGVYREVYQELRSMCVSVTEFIMSENADEMLGELDSGKYNTIAEYFSGVKDKTDIDISLFAGDVRYITTVIDGSGNFIKGTKASDEVINAVIKKKKEFFSDKAEVNGVSYFGYYMPIYGTDGIVKGMTFAGKSRRDVDAVIYTTAFNSILLSLVATVVAMSISLAFSARMVRSLDATIEFMKRVSTGDTDFEPEKITVDRGDEIGEIGRSAVALRGSLKSLISTDPLTGLLNRRSCNIKLSDMYDNNESYTAVIGDIDLFKSFNDKYGHACGDEVLKHISGIFEKYVGDSGFVSRWGGEEFLIVIAGSDYSAAMDIVTNIRKAVKDNCIEYNGEKLCISLTFGVERSAEGVAPEETVSRADKKLYYGKNHGRNCVIEDLPEDIDDKDNTGGGNTDSRKFVY